jgi:AcrR family transcriptional regulator
MSECTGGRRERRKAQTRADVREAAQRLFCEHGFDAVTIADVAAAADVAVQTVFNHFESKEALFFDGRTPWVERLATGVSQRPAGSDPVSALRSLLESYGVQFMEEEARPENRGFVAALEKAPSLQARERTLVQETGVRIAAVLSEAFVQGDWPAAPTADRALATVLGRLVADTFLAACRVLVLENRRRVLEPGAAASGDLAIAATTQATLAALEQGMRELAGTLRTRRG